MSWKSSKFEIIRGKKHISGVLDHCPVAFDLCCQADRIKIECQLFTSTGSILVVIQFLTIVMYDCLAI